MAPSAIAGAAALEWGGHRVELLPQRAAWLPQRHCLLVADLHLGKALSFRRLGAPVPRGTTADTLQRLSGLLQALGARELVVLGDFLHAPEAQAPAVHEALLRWRAAWPDLALTLVRGNHDDRAGDPPAALGLRVVDEPWCLAPPAALAAGIPQAPPLLALAHHPLRRDGAQVLAGHLHPCVHLSGRARDRLRLPCFHFAQGVGVLPAFGAFTGMHPVRRTPGDQVWAAADRVVALR